MPDCPDDMRPSTERPRGYMPMGTVRDPGYCGANQKGGRGQDDDGRLTGAAMVDNGRGALVDLDPHGCPDLSRLARPSDKLPVSGQLGASREGEPTRAVHAR